MLISNITIKVDNSILNEWIKWQKKEHLPEIMSTNLFEQYKFFRLLDQDDSEGPTFVIQFYVQERKSYDRYIKVHAQKLREKAFKKWDNKFIAFRSLLESVQ